MPEKNAVFVTPMLGVFAERPELGIPNCEFREGEFPGWNIPARLS